MTFILSDLTFRIGNPGAKWLFETISFLITQYLSQINQIFKNDESTWIGNFINFPIRLVTRKSAWLILMIRSSNFEPKTRRLLHYLRFIFLMFNFFPRSYFSAFTLYIRFEIFLGQSYWTRLSQFQASRLWSPEGTQFMH